MSISSNKYVESVRNVMGELWWWFLSLLPTVGTAVVMLSLVLSFVWLLGLYNIATKTKMPVVEKPATIRIDGYTYYRIGTSIFPTPETITRCVRSESTEAEPQCHKRR
jgi:hypothetical protein